MNNGFGDFPKYRTKWLGRMINLAFCRVGRNQLDQYKIVFCNFYIDYFHNLVVFQ